MIVVKEENNDEADNVSATNNNMLIMEPIEISSGSSSSSSSSDSSFADESEYDSITVNFNDKIRRFLGVENGEETLSFKKPKLENSAASTDLPRGTFVDQRLSLKACSNNYSNSYQQLCDAGDYDHDQGVDDHGNLALSTSVGMDLMTVDPRFLYSNATSHKWALGAFAELLDNSLDEVCNGATFVKVDVLRNKKDGSNMLLVEDNGGGMTPEKMRKCISLGYSFKSNYKDPIGQYGNGLKTSTMRLARDVIVFSRCQGDDGISSTQSIAMLSYSFLKDTGKEYAVIPRIDYEKSRQDWKQMPRTTLSDWKRNLATIVQWSPYSSEDDLLQQFDSLKEHGTRIVMYKLWEDEQGQLELDFDTDPHDIQIRGVNRDEKSIHMAKQYPNCRHFLTYKHSLRSYASILYLRLPRNFRIILRGKDVKHHNLVNDLKMTWEVTYKPVLVSEEMPNDSNMAATVTVGFVKDAEHHIDVQGFNVYHKNRLIKPFWRVWNPAGSDGRGVIGILEASFIKPAHDKQDFPITPVFERLRKKLMKLQKDYWSRNCQKVGYAARRGSVKGIEDAKENLLKADQNVDSSPSLNTKRRITEGASCFGTRDGKSCNGGKIENHNKSTKHTCESKERFWETEEAVMVNLLNSVNYEKDRCKSLEAKLEEEQQRLEEMDREQKALIEIIVEERTQREEEEERLRKRLREASQTIEQLREKIMQLEGRKVLSCKVEK